MDGTQDEGLPHPTVRVSHLGRDTRFPLPGQRALMVMTDDARATTHLLLKSGVTLVVVGIVASVLGARSAVAAVGKVVLSMGLGVVLASVGTRALGAAAGRAPRLIGSRLRARLLRAPRVNPRLLADGRTGRVRGRVRSIRASVGGAGAPLMRRVRVWCGGEVVDVETTSDFLLEHEAGEPALVETRFARLDEGALAEASLEEALLAAALAELPVGGYIRAAESAIADGDLVDVVGAVERRVDPGVQTRLGRDVPIRIILAGTAGRPLLVRPLA